MASFLIILFVFGLFACINAFSIRHATSGMRQVAPGVQKQTLGRFHVNRALRMPPLALAGGGGRGQLKKDKKKDTQKDWKPELGLGEGKPCLSLCALWPTMLWRWLWFCGVHWDGGINEDGVMLIWSSALLGRLRQTLNAADRLATPCPPSPTAIVRIALLLPSAYPNTTNPLTAETKAETKTDKKDSLKITFDSDWRLLLHDDDVHTIEDVVEALVNVSPLFCSSTVPPAFSRCSPLF